MDRTRTRTVAGTRRCLGRTTAGEQCRKAAQRRSLYCGQHPAPFAAVMAAAIVAVAAVCGLGYGCIWLAVQATR